MPRIRTCSYELQLNWSFEETSLPWFSMMWTTRELAKMKLQNELHARTTLDRRWTYTRLKNRSSPKGGHGGTIRKKLGECDTPKINASVEGQNWGSKNMPLFNRVNEQVKHECEVQAMNWVKWTLVKNSNDQQFYPHTIIKKAKGNESCWSNGLGDPGKMLEKVIGIWTRCQKRPKKIGRDAGKDRKSGHYAGKEIVSGRVLENPRQKWSYPGEY